MPSSHDMPVITRVELPDRERVGTLVSLYSGAGGLDLGFRQAGFDAVWANDIDVSAVETYNKALDGHVARAGDLADWLDTLPSAKSVDLVVGGPPCQGFSVAGKSNPKIVARQRTSGFLPHHLPKPVRV